MNAGTDTHAGKDIYTELGITPVINARGNATILGGSRLGPVLMAAMEKADRHFVYMEELLERTGQIVAELLGCEAAYVTPGCAAALTLGAAACVTGGDSAKMARLPDTTDMKAELLIQARHRYKYERAATVAGPRLREVGDAQGTTARQLEEAIGSETAAVFFPAHLDGTEGTVPLRDAIAIAHRHDVPVLVDAAGQIFPPQRMGSFSKLGADLVGFGAKYFGAPNSTGILTGRRDLLDAAVQQGFIGFELGDATVFGRPLKVDRQEAITVVVGLRDWLAMDHDARIARDQAQLDTIAGALEEIAGVSTSLLPGRHFGAPGLQVRLDAAAPYTAEGLAAALREGRPSISVKWEDDSVILVAGPLAEGEAEIVARRLRELLTA